jgi:hypothetical protein
MSKKSINVIGIMIGAEYKDYRLYQMYESREKNERDGTYTGNSTSGSGSFEGFGNILGYLSDTPADTQLSVISEKATKLRNDGHLTAADKADQLYTNLTKSSQTYFAYPTEEAYVTFKNQIKDDIKNAHKELDKHRGWKRLLGNIGLAILGFGILYLAAVVINRNVFFNKTDSAEKLDNLEKFIDNNTYQMK